MYPKHITHEIIRLQANGFTIRETQAYLKEHYQINPHRNTVHSHRHSPIGIEMLNELIRHQERSILKADSTDPQSAMRYRADLIGKMMNKLMPDLNYVSSEQTIKEEITHNINVTADQELLLDALARKYIKTANTAESASIH